jgi:tetratricopeptide (TPR) repeat protein
MVRWVGLMLVAGAVGAQTAVPAEISAARAAMQAKEFVRAKAIYGAYAKAHGDSAAAWMGLGDAERALQQYEAAELDYRHAVMLQPENWVAHKSLVLVEAKLKRWEEFDRERAVLRGARERGAANITKRESDVIDSFDVGGKQWTVREYYEPVGRSEARYNFEHFEGGRVAEYVSLEPVDAAVAALKRDEAVAIGVEAAPVSAKAWALNWYTGSGHGVVKAYPKGEPTYEVVRADMVRWLGRSRSK